MDRSICFGSESVGGTWYRGQRFCRPGDGEVKMEVVILYGAIVLLGPIKMK